MLFREEGIRYLYPVIPYLVALIIGIWPHGVAQIIRPNKHIRHILNDFFHKEEKELETEAASAQEELFNSLTGELDDIANFVDIAEMGDIDINFVKPGVFTLPSYPSSYFNRKIK